MNGVEQEQSKNSRKTKSERHFFTEEEDSVLLKVMNTPKRKSWKEVATYLPERLPRQCRDRWHNYLAPWIKRGEWTSEEDEIIKKKVAEIGTKWTKIRKMLPGRTDNDIKNRWNTYLSKEREEREEIFVKFDFWKEIELTSVSFADFGLDLNCGF
jgi:predicted phosphoadenosine phosphosulfate sulfurtransferase